MTFQETLDQMNTIWRMHQNLNVDSWERAMQFLTAIRKVYGDGGPTMRITADGGIVTVFIISKKYLVSIPFITGQDIVIFSTDNPELTDGATIDVETQVRLMYRDADLLVKYIKDAYLNGDI